MLEACRDCFLVSHMCIPRKGHYSNLRLVVQKVVRQVVANIPKDPTAKHRDRDIPIKSKDGMRQVPEWRRQQQKQRRRHYESHPVHRKIVMYPMQ